MAWQTRAEARAQPFTALSGDQLDGILGAFDRRMRSISDDYLKKMGEHIAEIGTLIPSDIHRLQQLRRMRRNLRDIQRQIARAAGVSLGDVQKIFEHVATEDARMAARVMGRNPALVNDAPVKRILQAQLRETAGRLQNLSNTTVVSDAYRKAVDAGVSAVQSGVEDYGSAIRRTLREAGQMGLRVRDDGSRVVDYESGYSRRLDTAVRMNILDGVRHLNQSIMEEVGHQFGADGIEIDAHMLCAEDHLPYQGRQFSNADFEQIQSSLPRPFGEWNCRHSWHPILLGISQPAYTEAQLQEMRDYSTEEVTIDGRTKTRYEWSQEMRRCETAVRQQKDIATLAAAAGDDTLRRQCQGRIIALNDQYRDLANGAGLKPEFQRTNVQGFRDVKDRGIRENSGQILTGSANNGIMLSDSRRHSYRITPESVQAVPEFTEFDTPEANEAVRKACREILSDLIDCKPRTEEVISLPLSKLDKYLRGELVMEDYKRISVPGRSIVGIVDLDEYYIAIHNHPSCEPLNLFDAGTFAYRDNCIAIVAIGNNGQNTSTLIKGNSFDKLCFLDFQKDELESHIRYKSKKRDVQKGRKIWCQVHGKNWLNPF